MRTARLTKIAMVIFLSMIFFLGVQKPVLAAGKNTTVKIPVEQIFEVNNSADADKTGSFFQSQIRYKIQCRREAIEEHLPGI